MTKRDAIPPDPALLERGVELESIESALASAQAGSGCCLVLEGGAGLGKSRLAGAAAALAQDEGMTVLSARAAELERDFTFGVVIQLFGPLLLRSGAERDELLAGAAALSEPLFDATASDARAAGSEFPLLHGLHWLAANAAELAPLLIVVDDAHWSDLASLRYLAYLLQRLDELPIALVAAARPREPGAAPKLVARIAGHQLSDVQSLEPLTPDAVASVVRAELGPDADAELCSTIAAATGGNPFYVRELLAAVRAGGRAAAPEGLALGSESVSRTILGRIAQLPEPAARLVTAASVLGDGAPLERVADLAGIDADEAATAADALAAAAILEPGAPLAFVHPIVRDTVYSDIREAARARAHVRAAELLSDGGADAEQVASHLVQAPAAAGDWAVPALRRAALRARERGASATAASYLRGALSGLVRETDRGELLTELALAEAKARDDGVTEHAREAIAAIEARDRRAATALEIGMALVDSGHPDAGVVFDLGLESLGENVDPDDELAMALRASRAAVAFGHATTAPGDLEAIVDRARRGVAAPVERLMLAHGALAPALQGRDLDEIRRLARASLDGPLPDVTSPTAMAATSLAATALLMTGNFAEAEAAITPALVSARERGAVIAFGVLSHVRAHSLHRHGRLQDAIADAQSALDTARYGGEPELPAIHGVLALCLIERGELDAAEAALVVRGGEKRWSAALTWADLMEARGRLRLARGDPRAALADLLAAGEHLNPMNASHAGVVAWRAGAVEAALVLGETERAAELANEDLEQARAFGAPRELGLTLRMAGLVAGGDRGIELLRESVETLRASESQLELAHAMASLGDALLEEGHRLSAREALTGALDLAHACSADALEERARELLVATGARPRRASTRGSDALTPRERRIALMAAEGLGNREIAEALFITTKTVETHLGRAYRKLDIPGRGELAAALAEE